MTLTSYADVFWGGHLKSCSGYEALIKRNQENKKMCQEMEEYLKKRSKVEADYSKSLQNLAKCFKQKDEIGVIESTLNKMKSELDTLSQCHFGASIFYQQQSDTVKKFKEEQCIRRKTLEDSLNKAQNFKFAQLAKTIQLEKIYVRKYSERDTAELSLKEISMNASLPRDIEKAKNKAAKAEEEAEKADSAYKSAVKVLEDCRVHWEKEMILTCQSIQELDEERITFFRRELWVAANVASKIALDTDNSSESIREILEKCDIVSDIQAYIAVAKTGEDRPEPFIFRHYTKILASGDNDSTFHVYNTIEDLQDSSPVEPTTAMSNFMMRAALVRPRLLKKI